MFYILRTVDPPFSTTPPETICVATCAKVDDLTKVLQQHPGAFVAETFWQPGDGLPLANKVPPELARAVEAWNAIAPRTTPHLPAVKKVEPLIAPYRRWKARNGNRSCLLESVVEKVEAATGTHRWIRFAWLLGQKDGDENYEKILDERPRFEKKGRRAAGNGEDFEAVER